MSHPDYDFVLKFISGGVSGMIAKSVVAPIDRVKFLFMGTIRDFSIPAFKSELFRIIKQEGYKSFWKGNLAQIARVFPYAGIVSIIQQFAVYARSEKFLLKHSTASEYTKTLIKFISGSVAASVAVILTYPFDVIRTRLAYQTTGKVYSGIFHAFSTMFFKEGPRTIYIGLAPTVIGVSIYGGMSFGLFFSLKNAFPQSSNTSIFCYGALAGLTGQILSYPFDVVRKRMLAHGFIEKVSNYKSTFDGEVIKSASGHLRAIWKHEGVRGLLKGFSLNFVKAPIMLGTVHLANHLIHMRLNEDY